MPNKSRAAGFYWVLGKTDKELFEHEAVWSIAYFSSVEDAWYLVGCQYPLPDDAFEFIDENPIPKRKVEQN